MPAVNTEGAFGSFPSTPSTFTAGISKEEIPKGFIGIDPGRSSGSIAYVTPDGNHAMAWTLAKLTDRDILSIVRTLSSLWGARAAVLEQVHAMPKQGVSSTFKFGVSYGELGMALVAAEVRFERVTPLKWQAALKCRSRGNKNVTKTRAQELFPKLRVTHATADGLLIAEYGRRLFGAT